MYSFSLKKYKYTIFEYVSHVVMNQKKIILILFFLILTSCKTGNKAESIKVKTAPKISEIPTPEEKRAPKRVLKEVYNFIKEKTVVSKDFYLTKIGKKNIDFSDTERTIFLKHANGEIITEIKVDVESYDNDAKVMEITNHNLDNVKRIIYIDIDECICGCSITKKYILETTNGNYISLPDIDYSAVESGEPEYSYRFGKKNTIYAIEKTFNYVQSKIVLNAINRYKKLLWNGFIITDKIELTNNSYCVTAKKGLVVRDQPSLKGKKIDKFPYNSQIIVEKITDHRLELYDDLQLVKGNWVKVENYSDNNWKIGYVFDGFITKKTK